MKKLFLILLVMPFFINSAAIIQPNPPSSEAVLKEAFGQAARENKKVLIIFHASWCGWCHKMEASLNDPLCKKMFDDNFVIAYLDVLESKGKEGLENPGSMDVMKKYGNENSSLPFWLIFDAKQNVLANSFMPKPGSTVGTPEDNVGCPASDKEVAYFDEVLKKTSRLKEADIAIIHKRFLLNQDPPAKPAPSTKTD